MYWQYYRTVSIWDPGKCPLWRGCPLLRGCVCDSYTVQPLNKGHFGTSHFRPFIKRLSSGRSEVY